MHMVFKIHNMFEVFDWVSGLLQFGEKSIAFGDDLWFGTHTLCSQLQLQPLFSKVVCPMFACCAWVACFTCFAWPICG